MRTCNAYCLPCSNRNCKGLVTFRNLRSWRRVSVRRGSSSWRGLGGRSAGWTCVRRRPRSGTRSTAGRREWATPPGSPMPRSADPRPDHATCDGRKSTLDCDKSQERLERLNRFRIQVSFSIYQRMMILLFVQQESIFQQESLFFATSLMHVVIFFFNTIFVSSHMYPENPKDPSNRRLNEHGIYIRHCQESNSQPVPSQAGVDTTRPQWRTWGPFVRQSVNVQWSRIYKVLVSATFRFVFFSLISTGT